MLWLLLSVWAAFFDWIKNIFAKKLTKHYDEYLLAFSTSIVIFICISPYIFINGIPIIKESFFLALIITWVINTITVVLILKALKITDISLIIPIFSLSPVLLLLTSPLLIWEFPSFIGLIWIIIILLWTYVLNFKKEINFQPFIEIFKNKWQRLIIIVTILWSISSNYYKIWMQNSSPLFFIFSLNIVISLLLFPIIIKRKQFLILKNNFKFLLPLWILWALTSIFQWSAVNLNLIVYVLSIKRLSVIISIIWWYFYFKEKNTIQRLFATLIILIWVFLIAYY